VDGRVAWTLDNAWLAAQTDGTEPTVLVRLISDDAPKDRAAEGFLETQQQRLFSSISNKRDAMEAWREQEQERAAADPDVAPVVYLGKDRTQIWSSLSPNSRWLLVEHSPKRDTVRQDPMPAYVTDSGYVDTRDIRAKVGTQPHVDATLWMVSVTDGAHIPITLDSLPGRQVDPLEAVRSEPLEAPPERPIRVVRHAWSPSGTHVAVQLMTRDQKDRWNIVVDTRSLAVDDPPEAIQPTVAEHLHDDAWVNWRFNSLRWSDDQTLWFQSESSGWSHLYAWRDGESTALTEGRWEVHQPTATRDGRWIYFRANRTTPGEYEVYRVPSAGGTVERLTTLGGMNEFTRSPSERSLLIEHSEVMAPPELYVQAARPGARARRLTHTIGSQWSSIDWVQPTIEPIPSTHHDQPIWSKVYRPDGPTPAGGRPAVVFVHGAGYLQNSHAGWSYYFREAMFHSLLVEHGYVVLDMDYRASAGYGRDWRTAIHRQMGHPELEDLEDGVTWMVDHAGVDPERVGIYGGSYGGFLSLMALFRQPDIWAAGAALRPVTDWSNYNDGYTSAILHTPETDPEAYLRSSPIEHAEGLEDPLLICHGMLDSNVPYQDSVRLSQRLIELRKTDWELASYPLEGHSFSAPEAWLDEYRRILELFEETLQVETP